MLFIAWPDGRFDIAGRTVRAALGRGGVKPAADKREGDGATPAGVWPIRYVLHRGEAPATALETRPIGEHDGWCDDPADAAYNRPVPLPYPASCERLWRDDHLYDRVVVLGHNDDPPVTDAGSAIFLHLARQDYAPTEGCVAISAADMEALLELARPGDAVEIRL